MEKSKTKTVPKGLARVSKGLTYPLELVSALGMSYLGLAFCSSRALGVYVQWRGPPPPSTAGPGHGFGALGCMDDVFP